MPVPDKSPWLTVKARHALRPGQAMAQACCLAVCACTPLPVPTIQTSMPGPDP